MKSLTDIVASINESLASTSEDVEAIVESVVHPEIKKVLDSLPQDAGRAKVLNTVSSKIKGLAEKGETAGLSDAPLGTGSTRAVFSKTTPRNIEVDGKPVQASTVLKVAFKNALDSKHDSDETLGQVQNRSESDGFLHKNYSVLSPTGEGKFETNENGIFPPHFDSHEDHKWIEMGKIDKLKAGDFKELTKTKEHPKGLDFHKMKAHLENEYDRAQGKNPRNKMDENEEDSIGSHPFVEKTKDAMFNMGMHPGDISPRNMGVYTNPATGKKHLVHSDPPLNDELLRMYGQARKRK